jgi:plasmid maintenance system antidote protein VapI
MSTTQASTTPQPADGPLITKAFLRAGELLGLSQKDLADVIGISEAGISRLVNRGKALSIGGKETELALQFIRVFRSLGALLGGRETEMRKWLDAPNSALQGVPRELIKTLPGLFHVTQYLDAMRGKV